MTFLICGGATAAIWPGSLRRLDQRHRMRLEGLRAPRGKGTTRPPHHTWRHGMGRGIRSGLIAALAVAAMAGAQAAAGDGLALGNLADGLAAMLLRLTAAPPGPTTGPAVRPRPTPTR